jgi:hypothetical protein
MIRLVKFLQCTILHAGHEKDEGPSPDESTRHAGGVRRPAERATASTIGPGGDRAVDLLWLSWC